MSRSSETALTRRQVCTICRITAYCGDRWRAHLRRRFHKQAVTSLQSLDDRMLKDLGIERSEIESVVRGRDRDSTRISRTS